MIFFLRYHFLLTVLLADAGDAWPPPPKTTTGAQEEPPQPTDATTPPPPTKNDGLETCRVNFFFSFFFYLFVLIFKKKIYLCVLQIPLQYKKFIPKY